MSTHRWRAGDAGATGQRSPSKAIVGSKRQDTDGDGDGDGTAGQRCDDRADGPVAATGDGELSTPREGVRELRDQRRFASRKTNPCGYAGRHEQSVQVMGEMPTVRLGRCRRVREAQVSRGDRAQEQ
jgi:hypothetical protein